MLAVPGAKNHKLAARDIDLTHVSYGAIVDSEEEHASATSGKSYRESKLRPHRIDHKIWTITAHLIADRSLEVGMGWIERNRSAHPHCRFTPRCDRFNGDDGTDPCQVENGAEGEPDRPSSDNDGAFANRGLQ
jgi:hypothetical protein